MLLKNLMTLNLPIKSLKKYYQLNKQLINSKILLS